MYAFPHRFGLAAPGLLDRVDKWSDARVAETKAPRRRHLQRDRNLSRAPRQIPRSAEGPSAGLPSGHSAADGRRQALGLPRDRQRHKLQPPSLGWGARSNPPEAGEREVGLHEVSRTPKTSVHPI